MSFGGFSPTVTTTKVLDQYIIYSEVVSKHDYSQFKDMLNMLVTNDDLTDEFIL
jgi:hypothetical protein